MQALLQFLKEIEPIVQLATLVLLARYVWDTAKIKRASLRQSEALFQPYLVLEHRLRRLEAQVWDFKSTNTAATELPDDIFVVNIGTGPAQDILLSFDRIDTPENLWETEIPYVLAGDRIPINFVRHRFTTGEVTFDVRSM